VATPDDHFSLQSRTSDFVMGSFALEYDTLIKFLSLLAVSVRRKTCVSTACTVGKLSPAQRALCPAHFTHGKGCWSFNKLTGKSTVKSAIRLQ
jgi:hypothetical protein